MHKGKYVFAQLLNFIDKDVFLRIANKYGGNRYVKQFTCWNQLCVLMFGQLSNRESQRDLVLATQVHASKAYHLGLGKSATKSNHQKLTRTGTIIPSRRLHIGWSPKHTDAGQWRYSNLEGMYMRL